MRRFFENKYAFIAVFTLFMAAFTWNVGHGNAGLLNRHDLMPELEQIAHGASGAPDPWDGIKIAHGASGAPDPWDGIKIAHGASGAPDPWDGIKIAHGASGAPDPWDGVRLG